MKLQKYVTTCASLTLKAGGTLGAWVAVTAMPVFP